MLINIIEKKIITKAVKRSKGVLYCQNNAQLLLFGLLYMPYIKDSIDVIYSQLNIFLHVSNS